MRKGKSLALTQTRGREVGQFDLFDIEGLSLGKVDLIRCCLWQYHDTLVAGGLGSNVLLDEILGVLSKMPKCQTINGK
jgi:hypothetical protein